MVARDGEVTESCHKNSLGVGSLGPAGQIRINLTDVTWLHSEVHVAGFLLRVITLHTELEVSCFGIINLTLFWGCFS